MNILQKINKSISSFFSSQEERPFTTEKLMTRLREEGNLTDLELESLKDLISPQEILTESLRKAMEDGILTPDELKEFLFLQQKLEISDEELDRLKFDVFYELYEKVIEDQIVTDDELSMMNSLGKPLIDSGKSGAFKGQIQKIIDDLTLMNKQIPAVEDNQNVFKKVQLLHEQTKKRLADSEKKVYEAEISFIRTSVKAIKKEGKITNLELRILSRTEIKLIASGKMPDDLREEIEFIRTLPVI
ncbi:MAG: hypothetical protein EAZ97_11255 [Bacteroidetes bacterium]|nr:MAG: hypothetical protein EAZ97_11255 [Bacteroidota bacterium]